LIAFVCVVVSLVSFVLCVVFFPDWNLHASTQWQLNNFPKLWVLDFLVLWIAAGASLAYVAAVVEDTLGQ
jgi:hypothetical protein